ncbi:MAG: hypothetical protein QMD97_01390 [Candidatus Aenigmarchaeota archaeon]|nr:hypothetical protein [Candidatus Aenigmarchaeota archaeon]
MSKDDRLELPGSGYDVIEKILHAYVLCGDKPVTLDDVSGKAGMHKTQVSKNSAFLSSIGVIGGGKRKALTPQGKDLALAIGNKVADDIVRQWNRVLTDSVNSRGILDMIRVQGALSKETLLGKTASILGLIDDKNTRTGLNCLLEIFQKSGLLVEQDGSFSLSQVALKEEAGDKDSEKKYSPSLPEEKIKLPIEPIKVQNFIPPAVHIDIQIHIDASASADQIDHIFASMAKHIYQKG